MTKYMSWHLCLSHNANRYYQIVRCLCHGVVPHTPFALGCPGSHILSVPACLSCPTVTYYVLPISAAPAACLRPLSLSSSCLFSRPARQLGDKADLVKKGSAPHEAANKLQIPTKQLQDATMAWVDDGIKLADA